MEAASCVTPHSGLAAGSWHAISEILLPLFQAMIEAGDLWSLAASSLVCKTWRRLACVVAERYADLLRSQPPSLGDMKKLCAAIPEMPTGKSFKVLPAPPPFRQDSSLGSRCNSVLGSLLGRGSFSRVYNVGAISPWCVKVASGGLATTDRFTTLKDKEINAALKHELHVPTLEYYYYSSGRIARLLSHKQVGQVLLFEYHRLQDLAQLELPTWEKTPLFPRPYAFGVVECTAYYVMEKMRGVTMRKVLLSALRNNTIVDTLTIDFAPLVARLVRYMVYLLSKGSYHGDLKPENIMLVADSNRGGYCLRLIDPIPMSNTKGLAIDGIITLPYNPAAFLDWRADFASLLLLLSEIKTGERPFDRMRGVDSDFPLELDLLRKMYFDVLGAKWPPGHRYLLKEEHAEVYAKFLQHITSSEGGKFCLTIPRFALSAISP